MKLPRAVVLLLGCGAVFSAGYAVRSWQQARSTPTVTPDNADNGSGADRRERPHSPLPDAAQAKADARAASTSPANFLASLRNLSGLEGRSRIIAAVSVMSLAEVQDLARRVGSLGYSGDPRQWDLLSSAYERWADLDVEGLVTAAQRSGDQMMSYRGMQAAFRKLAELDPDRAWARANDLGPVTSAVRQSVLSTLATREPERALALMLKESPSGREIWTSQMIFRGWISKDPKGAIAAFEKLPAGAIRTNATQGMAEAFARTDREGALAWGLTLKNPAEREQVLSAVVQALAIEDPKRALAMAEDPAFPGRRREALSSAVSAWAKQDFDAAFAYANGCSSPADRQSLLMVLNQNANNSQRTKLLELAETLPTNLAKSIYQSALHGSYWGSNVDEKEVIEKIKFASVREEIIKSSLDDYWGDTPSGNVNCSACCNRPRRPLPRPPTLPAGWAGRIPRVR